MKGLTTVLCAASAAQWALAAPVVMLDKVPSQSVDASHVRQTTQTTQPTQSIEAHSAHQTKLAGLLAFFSPPVVPAKKGPIVVAEDGQRIQIPDHLAGPQPWETPNVLRFLSSLARPKKLLPFPESSIMREETRANNPEIEPQETIVELETKANRESWTYIPYVDQDNVVHFHCVRKTTEPVKFKIPTMFLAIPMVISAMISATFFGLLLAAIRSIYRSSCSAKRGAIRLDDEETATPGSSLKVSSQSQQPQVLALDEKAVFPSDGAAGEKS